MNDLLEEADAIIIADAIDLLEHLTLNFYGDSTHDHQNFR